MIIDFLIFISLLVVLILSGIITTRSVTKISSYLKLGHFAAGFIIIALATGIPELVVGVTSALEGIPELSLGNILGSNVVNLSLIIGIAVLIAGQINLKDNEIKKELTLPFFIALIPVILALDGELSRFDGLILITIFIIYLLLVIRKTDFEEEDVQISSKQFIISLILFTSGLIILLISAKYLVDYASLIALELGVPVFFIGIILISFGTSLPELLFETISLLHGFQHLAIGDLMGSTVANSTLILGTVAVITPILVPDFTELQIVSIFLLILISLFIIFIRSKNGITRLKALFLIIIYIIFLIITGINYIP